MATLRIVNNDQVITAAELTDHDLAGAVLAINDEFSLRGGYWFKGVTEGGVTTLQWVPAAAAQVHATFDADLPDGLGHLARK